MLFVFIFDKPKFKNSDNKIIAKLALSLDF